MGQSCCNKPSIEQTNEQMTEWCQNIEGIKFCENLDDIFISNDYNSNHARILNSQINFTFQQQLSPTFSQESIQYEKMNSLSKQSSDEDSPKFKTLKNSLQEE